MEQLIKLISNMIVNENYPAEAKPCVCSPSGNFNFSNTMPNHILQLFQLHEPLSTDYL